MSRRAVTALAIEYAEQERWELVDEVIAGIVEGGGPRAVYKLLVLVEQASDRLRVTATRALGKLGHVAKHALTDLLRDGNREVCVAAAWSLLLHGDSRHVVELLETGMDDLAPQLVRLGELGIRVLCQVEPGDLDDYWSASLALAKAPAAQHQLIAELAKTSKVAHFAHRIINRQRPNKERSCQK